VRFTSAEMKPDGAEADGDTDQQYVRAQEVVRADATEEEGDRGDGQRGEDEQEDVGERRAELADDQSERAERRGDEQVEGLLLALERDGAGREGGCQDYHQDGLDEEQAREQRLADLRRERDRCDWREAESVERDLAGDGVALILVDAPREDGQEHEVERQDGKSAAAAHPAAELLGADGDDARADAEQAVHETAEGVPHGGRGDHRSAPAVMASAASRAVT
jgi:hypothetical protein